MPFPTICLIFHNVPFSHFWICQKAVNLEYWMSQLRMKNGNRQMHIRYSWCSIKSNKFRTKRLLLSFTTLIFMFVGVHLHKFDICELVCKWLKNWPDKLQKKDTKNLDAAAWKYLSSRSSPYRGHTIQRRNQRSQVRLLTVEWHFGRIDPLDTLSCS